MISTDFAPNESWDDAWLSFKLLFQPWRWRRGKETDRVNWQIGRLFANKTVYLSLAGRSALFTLLDSLKLPKNSRVLVQGYTCEAVVLPIIRAGLQPVYVDIETNTYGMDWNDFQRKLSVRSRVLILQHSYGLTPVNRLRIINHAIGKGLVVIEDLAHGWDRRLFSRSGSWGNRHYVLLSFGRSKAISSVFGAGIVGDNKPIAKLQNTIKPDRRFPGWGFLSKCLLYKPVVQTIKAGYDWGPGRLLHYWTRRLGLLLPEITAQEKAGQYNIVFDRGYPNALAILLLHQLEKFDQTAAKRLKAVNYYQRLFKKISSRRFVNSQALIRYPLQVENPEILRYNAAQRRLFLGQWYSQPIAPSGLDLTKFGYRAGDCPIAEWVCRHIINLPTNITLAQAGQVIKTLNDVGWRPVKLKTNEN
ncbi:DegT/DnrJ/EryC1/StrS family aminotransferase [Patescibacteria group bacterium]|nr:DegT/DnrJ/EryC1/StrS family aminotransferase [Patescibacteria group bacterium]MCL5091908.1 DegT/DnrJ/EryC1/StrS family aminotransferase [Patescibacteria group bacterium]